MQAGKAFDGSWGVGVVPPLESLGFTQFCGCEIDAHLFIYWLRWMQLNLTFHTNNNVTPSLSLP